MIKALIGNGGHAREVMAQMGIKLFRFVDDLYMDNDTLPLSESGQNTTPTFQRSLISLNIIGGTLS